MSEIVYFLTFLGSIEMEHWIKTGWILQVFNAVFAYIAIDTTFGVV